MLKQHSAGNAINWDTSPQTAKVQYQFVYSVERKATENETTAAATGEYAAQIVGKDTQPHTGDVWNS